MMRGHSTFGSQTRPLPRATAGARPGGSRDTPDGATDFDPLVLAGLLGGGEWIPRAGNRSLVYRAVKRGLDAAGAGLLIALTAPLFCAVLVVLLLTTRGRPLFFQERVGAGGRRFWLAKFRTMMLNAGDMQHLVENQQDGPVFKNRYDPRVTSVGRWLRRTSIDELPQLFCVLWGTMSLVGPRPPVATEVVQYEPWQLRRLSVKPGLTCLWQVSGRCEIGFLDWVRMDLWYVRNQGIWTDLALAVRTPWSVLAGRGAY